MADLQRVKTPTRFSNHVLLIQISNTGVYKTWTPIDFKEIRVRKQQGGIQNIPCTFNKFKLFFTWETMTKTSTAISLNIARKSKISCGSTYWKINSWHPPPYLTQIDKVNKIFKKQRRYITKSKTNMEDRRGKSSKIIIKN